MTGGNRGLGLAFARGLAARGDRVIATARRPHEARALEALPVRVEALDVADDGSIEALARALSGEPVDVLINNAAIGEAGPGVALLTPEDLERSFRVNAIGPLAVTQALLANLRAGRRRLVVNLSSDLASISANDSGGWSAYRASKAALNQLTRTFAAEMAGEGFTFIVISPGWVRTDMGGSDGPLSSDESVAAMLPVLDRLGPQDTGRFYDQRGKRVPW
ncbi:MAG TPA: SDR family oxidoreductase [Thermoanaerobaculia bacterium]|nr:SDR family oxidoreductase [Thermoanaerobaculia bacterium]